MSPAVREARDANPQRALLDNAERGALGAAAVLNFGHVALVLISAMTSLVLIRYDIEGAFAVATFVSVYVMLLVFYRAYRATGDAFNIMSLGMFVMLLLYPVHGLIMVDSTVTMQRLGAERYEFYTYGLLTTIPACWMLYRGFLRTRAGRFARAVEWISRPISDESKDVERKLVLVVGIAISARVILVLGGTGTYVNLGPVDEPVTGHFFLSVISSASLISAIFLVITGARLKKRRRIIIGATLVLVEALWGGLFSGSRYHFFEPLLSVVAAYSLSVKPILLTRFAAIIVVFLLVFFPLTTAYKTAYLSSVVDLQRDGLSTSAVGSALEATDIGQAMDADFLEPVGIRFHGLLSAAVIIRYTPERHPFLLGRLYAILPIDILIPRFIWPDKPFVREFAAEFRFAYWQLDRSSQSTVKTSQIGELWVNFHLFGVLLGSWLCGRLFRFMYSNLWLGGRHSVFGVAVYGAVLPGLITALESDLVTALSFVFKSMFVWIALTWFLGHRRTPGELTPATPGPSTRSDA